MADETAIEEDAPKKGGMMPLLIGLVLAVLLGAGGAYAVYSGMVKLPIGDEKAEQTDENPAKVALDTTSFVELESFIVPLASAGRLRQVRVSITLEIATALQGEVEAAMPRVRDTLIAFLRAADERDLIDPTNLERLRALMLRRIQLETPAEAVTDVLLAEFMFV